MATATTEITVHLTLTKKEARMLKEVVQNPLFGTPPNEEAFLMKQWRESIWGVLPSLQELT